MDTKLYDMVKALIHDDYKKASNLFSSYAQEKVKKLIGEKASPSSGLTKKQKSNLVKKAKVGKDIGKKGKNFKKIAAAAEKNGATDGDAVAASIMWKNAKRK